MSDQHERLKTFIREHADVEAPPSKETLNQLFVHPDFVKTLFEHFSLKRDRDTNQWEQWVQETAGLPFSERCLSYLAFQYGVGTDTIERAIWPRAKTP